MSLNEEASFFDEQLAAWLSDHEGKYVLIKGSDFAFFDTEEEAYETAVDKYGDADVLIKQVLPSDPIDGSLTLLYGLLDGSDH